MTEATTGRYVYTAGVRPPEAVRERLRDWWLTDSGLSLEELRELAELIWPSDDTSMTIRPREASGRIG